MRFTARAYFEKRDAWVGLFWDKHVQLQYTGLTHHTLQLYLCLIPFLPVNLTIRWESGNRVGSQN